MSQHISNPQAIIRVTFHLVDYIELLDWTGRAVLENKKGVIPQDGPAALQRVGIFAEHLIELTTHFEDRFKGVVGSVSFLQAHYRKFKLTRLVNRSNRQLLFC